MIIEKIRRHLARGVISSEDAREMGLRTGRGIATGIRPNMPRIRVAYADWKREQDAAAVASLDQLIANLRRVNEGNRRRQMRSQKRKNRR